MNFLKLTTLASVPLLILSCTQPLDDTSSTDTDNTQTQSDTNQAPTASLSSVVTDNTVAFTSNASDPENDTISFQWDFGDSTSSTEANPNHYYTQDGTYNVVLTLTDSNGKQNVITTQIIIDTSVPDEDNLAPQSSPSFNVNANVVTFSANTTDNENDALTYLWTFSDGETSVDENPVHEFLTSGAHFATLEVSDSVNPAIINTVNFTINNLAPVADFTYSENALTVMVDASISSDPENESLQYIWDFNSESTLQGVMNTHEFSTPGDKVISLTVIDASNNETTISKTINVSLQENLAPTAQIQVVSVNDLLVVLSAQQSTDPENDDLTYSWNFDNEMTLTGLTPSYEFQSEGEKTIWLEVRDTAGNVHQTSTTLMVNAAVNQAPTASFEASSAGLIVNVDAGESSDPENDALTYEWNFNNEASGQSQQTSYEFTSSGNKTISLIVTDANGNESVSVSQVINISEVVNATPVSYFDYAQQNDSNTYAFTALATDAENDSLTYVWSDNSVEFSTDQNPTYTLNDDGYHTIELSVSDGNTSHTYSVQILIGDGADQAQGVNLNLDLPKEYSLVDNGEILELGGNYESDFYDDSTIEDIYIEFSNDNWETTLAANYDSETFESATLTYQGEVFSQVGVRYRGNTSYQRAGDKKSFAVELDWLVDGQDIDGYNFLKLNNAYEDPSNIREVLYNNLITDHIPAAKGSFVNVYVNGVNYGVFANVQKLDKDHTKEWFFDKDSARWRAEEPNSAAMGFYAGDSTLNNKGSSGSDYESFYTLKGSTDALDPWQNLADAAYTMGTAPQNTLVDDLNPYLDIDAALWFLAVENLFTDDDGYINKGSMDYFVYLDVTTNRIMPIEFDGNSVLAAGAVDDEGGDTGGGGGRPGQEAEGAWDPFHKEDDADYPLINILMANEELRQRYLAHYRTLVEESFDPTTVQAKITEYKNLISSHVQAADVRQYSDAEFEADITELSELVARRHTYVLANVEVDAQGVEINSVVDSVDGVASIRPTDSQSVLVQASVATNVNTASVNLYYGTALVGTFNKVAMSDSDNNNVYEASIPAQAKAEFVRYYVEVIADDAANTATYSPVGAEHDVYIYQVQAAVVASSDVVINELMSSNDTIVSDETGAFEDWAELYNNSDQAVDLSGYYLTDEDTNLTRWEFPSGTIIEANSTLIIWVDDDGTSLDGLHTNFNLSANGESLYLVTPDLAFADSVTFGASNADESYARSPNGTGEFIWTTSPSFNAVNP